MLLIIFLAPALCAQEKLGTGTLIALVTNEYVIIDISSSTIYERLKYVNDQEFTRFPSRYASFRPTVRQGRNDLRVVHQEVARLQEMGWVVASSNHSLADSEERELTEKMIFHFRVPPGSTALKEGTDDLGEVLVSDYDFGSRATSNYIAAMYQHADGSYTFRVEERLQREFRPIFTLHDQGIASGDLPQFLKNINITKERLRLEYEMANGSYEYEFRRSGTDYLLSRINYTSESECGTQDFRLNLQRIGGPVAFVTYRPEDCASGEDTQSGNFPVSLDRYSLSDFTPLVNRLELTGIGQALIY